MKATTNFLSKILMLFVFFAYFGVNKSFAANFVVTNLNQNAGWNNTANDGSFFGALKAVNAQPAGTSHTISFNLPGTGPFVFDIQASMTVTNTVTIDGFTQTGASCTNHQIVLSGQGWTNITLNTNNSVVQGLVFQGTPLIIDAGSTANKVYSCYFNLNAAGTAAAGPAVGNLVTIQGSSTNNIIGGTTCAKRNVFSGSSASSTNGVAVNVISSDGNSIVGNYVGTDFNGTSLIGGFNGLGAVIVNNSNSVTIDSNTVVGAAVGAGILTSGGTSNNLTIRGNNLGIRADGVISATDFGNFNAGIYLNANTNSTLINNNVVTSNGNQKTNLAVNSGIFLYANTGVTISNVTLSNNFVGVSRTYAKSGNDFAGIYLQGTLGTMTNITISGNIIGDNGGDPNQKSSGIATRDIASASATNIKIYGNYVGMTPTGGDIGNYHNGMEIYNTSGVTIGGTAAGQRNYVGYNKASRPSSTDPYGAGILITSNPANTSGNIDIINNYIGVQSDGTTAAPQANAGASFSNNNGIVVEKSNDIRIGGTGAGQGNIIANSGNDGVLILAGSDNIQLRRNSISCNAGKGIDLNLSSSYSQTPGNNSYAAPVITALSTTTVSGTSPSGAIIEIYYDAGGTCARSCSDPNLRQGKTFVAQVTATGTSWTYTLPSGTFTGNLTATATSPTGTNAETSQFATCNICVPPTPSITGTAAVCENTTSITFTTANNVGSTYSWTVPTGATITAGGSTNQITVTFATGASSGNVSVTETNGCAGSANYAVTVDKKPTSNAGSTQNICGATTATLAGNNPAVGTGAWTVQSGTATITSASTYNSGVTGLAANGTAVLKWTVSNGACAAATSTVTINTYTTPVSTAGATQNICGATTATLAANNPSPGTGAWTVQSGTATITTASSATSGVTGLAANGTAVLLWTVSNGTCTAATSTVTINTYTTPVSNAGTTQNICGATTATLAANNPSPGTGAWTVQSGTATITTASSATSGVTGLAANGTAVLKWTVSNGTCAAATSTVTINTYSATVSNAGSTQNICGATTATLAANNPSPATGAWTVQSGTATVTTPSSATSGVTGLATNGTAVLVWTVSNGTCTAATSTVTINTYSTPVSTAGSAQNLCGATTATLAANNPSPGTGAWTVQSGTATITTASSATSGVTGLAANGTAVLKWTVSNGTCTAATSTVTINTYTTPVSNAGTTQNICGATTATLAANNPSPGTGAWTVQSGTATITTASSATSGVTGLAANGTAVLVWTVSNGTCTAATSTVTLNTNTTPTSNAGATQNLCGATTANITGNNPAPGTGVWSVQSGTATITSPNNASTGLTGLAADGSAVLKWTVSNGICTPATSTVTINTNSNPVAAAGASPYQMCPGGSVQITTSVTNGTGPFTYSWSPATNLSATNISNPIATPTSNITYTLIVSDSKGCSNSASPLQVPVVISTGLTVNAGSNNYNYCEGGSVQITTSVTGGTAPYTYAWSPATNLSATNIDNPTANPASSTSYTLVVTDSKGCSNNASPLSVPITVNKNPVATPSAASPSICEGASTQLNVNITNGKSPYTYTWSPAGTLDNAGIVNPTATPTATSTTYTVVVKDANNCTNTNQAQVTVTLNANPKLTASASSPTICAGQSSNLTAVVTDGTGPYSFTWTPSTTLSANNISDPVATPTTTTTYTVSVKDKNNCVNQGSPVTLSITVNTNPTVSASAGSPEICTGKSTQLSATGNGGNGTYTYSWSPADGLSSTTVDNPTANPTSSIVYTVVVTDGNGCTDANSKATVSLTVNDNPTGAVTADANAVCAGSPTNLHAGATGGTGPYSYTWTPASTLDDNTSSDPKATPSVETTYSVLITDSKNCSNNPNEAKVTIAINPNVTLPSAGADVTICSSSFNLVGNKILVGTGTWSLVSGRGTGTITKDPNIDSVAVATGLSQGENLFVWTVDGPAGTCGSGATDTIVITVANSGLSVSSNKKADTLCVGSTATIELLVNGSTATPYVYNWTSSDNSFNSVTPNNPVTVNLINAGWVKYYVNVVDQVGCQSGPTLVDSIWSIAPQALNIPNLITPNGDNKNDCWKITDKNTSPEIDILPGSFLEIYNRWGERVYQNKTYKNGDFCGSVLPDGVYYFYLKPTCGNKPEEKGWLHILSNNGEASSTR